MNDEAGVMHWTVYILECADKTLYTGITNDLGRRMAEHAAGKGARYTKGRGPFRLVYSETCAGRAEASRRETAIKLLDRTQKRQLCMVHGTDALQSGILQCEQSCKHVETHEATLLERVHNTLHRTGHDPTVP
jgi:putative endonuclease